jgi:hypothetical protein
MRKGIGWKLLALLLMILAPCAGAQQSAPFATDLTIAPWASSAVERLHANGILLGDPDGTFRGNRGTTRHETAVALARLLNTLDKSKIAQPDRTVEVFLAMFSPSAPSQVSTEPFKDVFPQLWDPIEMDLQNYGIVEGYPDATYHRRRSLTRAELATLIARTIQRLGLKPRWNLDTARFHDVTGSEWSFGAILVAAGSGIMQGYADHTFDGKQPVTRNEFAVTLARLLELAQSK